MPEPPMTSSVTSAYGAAGLLWSSQFVRKLLVQAGALLSLSIVCLALWVLYHTLQEIRLADVVQHLRELSAASILLGFGR